MQVVLWVGPGIDKLSMAKGCMQMSLFNIAFHNFVALNLFPLLYILLVLMAVIMSAGVCI